MSRNIWQEKLYLLGHEKTSNDRHVEDVSITSDRVACICATCRSMQQV